MDIKETKKVDISFRFDGDRYILFFNANPDFLENKIFGIEFGSLFGKLGKK